MFVVHRNECEKCEHVSMNLNSVTVNIFVAVTCTFPLFPDPKSFRVEVS